MDFDIIIYAVVAILVFARLWTVLGQRNSEDREQPNPFAAPPRPSSDKPSNDDLGGNSLQGALPAPLRAIQHAPDSLAGGLEQIKIADPSFDEKQFLQGAKAAFTIILDEFAKGTLVESARLMSPTILPHFKSAITERSTAGHVMDHSLIAIRAAECVAAKVENGIAKITVRFISEQESAIRDSQGSVVNDHSRATEEITDLWTFQRDTKSTDPNWTLVETKS